MTSEEYITRKTASTVTIVKNNDDSFTVTSKSFDPTTGLETDDVEVITLDAVKSEKNQLQKMLANANIFVSDLEAL